MGQIEQQRNKLLDLGFIQLQPPGNFPGPKATHPSMMPPATSHFKEGISTASHQEGHMEPKLMSPDSGCETTLEEASRGTGHVSPCPHRCPTAGDAGRMLRSSLEACFSGPSSLQSEAACPFL